jgi:hypothetical protein
MRATKLDAAWDDLMSLCAREKEYRDTQRHPKLLRFVSSQIDEIAAQIGFSRRQIDRREFRAERTDGHIVRIYADE